MSSQKRKEMEEEQVYQPRLEQESNEFEFSLKELLSYFGPGLLISIAYLDPGNLAGDMEAGIVGKYQLLWVLLLSTALGYYFQVQSMKLGLLTGKDMAKLCRIYIPRKQSLLLWVMAEIAIMGSDIQEVLGTAIGLKVLFNLDLWIGVLLTIFTTFLILLVKICGMRKLEVIFALLIGVMAISFFVNLGKINPNPIDILEGVFIPRIPSQAILASVGLIGAVLMPHNLYLHSALINEKEIDRNNTRLVAKSMFYFKIETALSLFLSFIISGAVICTFAHFSNQDTQLVLTNAGEALASQFGTAAKYIWGIGLLASGQSSTLTGTLAGQYVMSGFIKMKMSGFYRALLTRAIAIIPSVVIAFLSEHDDFNSYLNLLQAVQLPFAIIPLLKFSNCKEIMGSQAISQVEFTLLSILSAVIVFANYYSLVPSEINFKQPLTYVVGIFYIFYFVFLAIIINVKLENIDINKKYSDEIELNTNSHHQQIGDLENQPISNSNSINLDTDISKRKNQIKDV